MSEKASGYVKWKSNKRFKQKPSKKPLNRNHKKQEKDTETETSLEGWDLKNDKVNKFEEYPLSSRTKYGLRKNDYIKPTAIQKASLLSALKGSDILGAAKTGSGKTLAFIIPTLECLYRNQWNKLDGPGALIISPTRELAFQIFDVLQKVGCKHNFSAGLIIGGKDVAEEARRIQKTNIVVCTPGRLLQHLDQTSYFSLDNLKILVLDEADKILEMGFASTVNAVLENIPKERQTLLFSATQTQSVKDLARLSLQNPVFVSVHAESAHSTPAGLTQRYIICNLHEKFNILYSFVRNHVKAKTLVFMSSCKQVQYFFHVFCRLRPGVPVMHLHGRMNQQKRIAVYQEFCRKKFALLLSTDVAARGLDFPHIDWVIQFDCPEDANTYIHRVGRTARYHGNGNALLFLNPSEKEMLTRLSLLKVPIVVSEINTNKITNISNRLQSYCAEDKELKEKAQRCFVTYLRSVNLMKDKSVFCVEKLPLEEYSSSLGLACPPRVNFLRKKLKKQSEQGSSNKTQDPEVLGGWDVDESENENDDDLFTVKPDQREIKDETPIVENATEEKQKQANKKSKSAIARQMLKKGNTMNTKILFDEPEMESNEKDQKEVASGDESDNMEGGIDLEQAKIEMAERDKKDRLRQANRVKLKHKEARQKAKEERRQRQREKGSGGSKDAVLFNADSDNEEAEAEYAEGYEEDSEDFGSDASDEEPPKRRRIDREEEVEEEKEHLTEDMSLADKEDLALKLLTGKSFS